MENGWNIVVSDSTGDYYVIPISKREEWYALAENYFGVEEGETMPEWAHYIGGSCEYVCFRECVCFGGNR